MGPLISSLVAAGVLRTPAIISAFRAIDRKNFVLPADARNAYVDAPLPIGYGQTISQPYTVAFMLELLEPKQGQKILDVGSGSGWTTALLAQLVGGKGRVYGVEIVPELVAFGKENLSEYTFPHATTQESGTVLGLREHAPYDRILVSAATAATVPQILVNQLAIGGTMVIPVDTAILRVQKTAHDATETERHEGFAFVPLA